MKRALDTNVLIYAHIPAFPQHARVLDFAERQLADDRVTLIVTPLILHELVHVITDPKRFDPPVSMPEALTLTRLYLDHANVRCLAVDEGAVSLALDLIGRLGLGRTRIADSVLAATLIVNDVPEIITCNPRDFAAYEGLHAVDPR